MQEPSLGLESQLRRGRVWNVIDTAEEINQRGEGEVCIAGPAFEGSHGKHALVCCCWERAVIVF